MIYFHVILHPAVHIYDFHIFITSSVATRLSTPTSQFITITWEAKVVRLVIHDSVLDSLLQAGDRCASSSTSSPSSIPSSILPSSLFKVWRPPAVLLDDDTDENRPWLKSIILSISKTYSCSNIYAKLNRTTTFSRI